MPQWQYCVFYFCAIENEEKHINFEMVHFAPKSKVCKGSHVIGKMVFRLFGKCVVEVMHLLHFGAQKIPTMHSKFSTCVQFEMCCCFDVWIRKPGSAVMSTESD